MNLAQKQLTVCAYEVMWPDYFALTAKLEGHSFFDKAPEMVVLLEAEQPLETFLEGAFEAGLVEDAIIAQSLSDAGRFWDVREGHRLDDALPGLINFDVSLPLGEMSRFVDMVRADVVSRFADAKVLFFGHMGDGNLHAVIHTDVTNEAIQHEIDLIVYGHVRHLKGSVSAEHGIGLLKKDWLSYSRSADEITAMQAIKSALDPKGIMNPGKLI